MLSLLVGVNALPALGIGQRHVTAEFVETQADGGKRRSWALAVQKLRNFQLRGRQVAEAEDAIATRNRLERAVAARPGSGLHRPIRRMTQITADNVGASCDSMTREQTHLTYRTL